MLLSSNVLCAAPLSSTSTSIEPVPFVMTCTPLARLRRNVLPRTSAVIEPPSACSRRPLLPGDTVSVSRNVESVTFSCDSVPDELTTRALSSGEFATSVRVNSELPARLTKCRPASSVAASSPLLSTTESRSAKFVTDEPRIAVAEAVADLHALQRDRLRRRQRDGVLRRALDRAAAARVGGRRAGAAGAGDVEAALRAGRVQADALRGAVGRDRVEVQVAGHDPRRVDVQADAGARRDRVAGAADGQPAEVR